MRLGFDEAMRPGDDVSVSFLPSHLLFFDPETGSDGCRSACLPRQAPLGLRSPDDRPSGGFCQARQPPQRALDSGRERAYALLFLVPTAVLFLVLIGYPLVYSLVLMFSGRSETTGGIGAFVGFGNWTRLLSDPVFAQSLVQTLMYVLPSVLIGIPLGLGVALVLNERFPGRGIARAALLIPWALPPVVVASMFQWLLDSRRGLLGVWMVKPGSSMRHLCSSRVCRARCTCSP